MSLLMTILSFFFLDSTSIGAYPFLSLEAGRVVHPHNPDPQRADRTARAIRVAVWPALGSVSDPVAAMGPTVCDCPLVTSLSCEGRANRHNPVTGRAGDRGR